MMWLDSVNGENGFLVSSMDERLKAVREQAFLVELNGQTIFDNSGWEKFKSREDVDHEVHVVLKKKLSPT